MKTLVSELVKKGHRVRLVIPAVASTLIKEWNEESVEWRVLGDISFYNKPPRKELFMGTYWKESLPLSTGQVTDSNKENERHKAVTSMQDSYQTLDSPIDQVMSVLSREKSAWKTLNLLPKLLLFPLRENMFDSLVLELRKERPDVILADMGALAAWDAADLLGIPLVLLFCDSLFPYSLSNGAWNPFLPPHWSGYSRYSTKMQRLSSFFQKWLQELFTSLAMNKLNRLRWYHRLDTYRCICDFLCKGHTYLFPTGFYFEIPRKLPENHILSGPLIPSAYHALIPSSALSFAQKYAEEIIFMNLEGLYLSNMTVYSMLEELQTLSVGFWWINGSYSQPKQLIDNFFSLEANSFVTALETECVRLVIVPCVSDVVQQVLYFGKPVICIATGAVHYDVAIRLQETHAGESIVTSVQSITQDLIEMIHIVFSQLEEYTVAAINISSIMKSSSCGMDCIHQAIEHTAQGRGKNLFKADAVIDTSLTHSSRQILYYFSILYVISSLFYWFWIFCVKKNSMGEK
eukprot:jgi/Galph1/2654/GphlegSOOS_G1313.1